VFKHFQTACAPFLSFFFVHTFTSLPAVLHRTQVSVLVQRFGPSQILLSCICKPACCPAPHAGQCVGPEVWGGQNRQDHSHPGPQKSSGPHLPRCPCQLCQVPMLCLCRVVSAHASFARCLCNAMQSCASAHALPSGPKPSPRGAPAPVLALLYNFQCPSLLYWRYLYCLCTCVGIGVWL